MRNIQPSAGLTWGPDCSSWVRQFLNSYDSMRNDTEIPYPKQEFLKRIVTGEYILDKKFHDDEYGRILQA